VFFILSGFILAYNYAGRVNSKRTYKKFLWARVARIYPMHLTALFFMLVIVWSSPDLFMDDIGHDFPNTPVNFMANIFMLQSLPGFRAFVAPSWSLSCEFAGYFLFPVLAWWVLKMSSRTALIWATVIALAGMLALIGTAGTDPNWTVSYHGMWLRVSTDFTLGVLLWAWWRAKDRRSPRWDIAAVASVALVIAFTYIVPPGSPSTFLALPLVAAFVVACASATGPVGRLFSTPVMQWCGRLTFGLYLAHVPAKLIVLSILPMEDFVDAGLPVRIGWLLAMLAWVMGLTLVLHYVIEEPSRKRMLTWYARRQNPAVAAPAGQVAHGG
jgi:peptidoglycan/LPS O-acetylase OafA/YrhL